MAISAIIEDIIAWQGITIGEGYLHTPLPDTKSQGNFISLVV